MNGKERIKQPDFQYLVENANAIIVCFSTEGIITYANDFALKFFEFSAEELIGAKVLETITPATDSAGYNLETLIAEISQLPESYQININENIKKSGERVWVRWSNCVQLDDRGDICGAMSIGIDITRQLELERQISQIQKLDALGVLAGGVAHDFNNIAQGMSGFAEMIKLETSSETIRRYANSIISAASDVGDITNNLLSYSRTATTEFESVDIVDVVSTAVSLVESSLQAGMAIKIDCPQKLGTLRLDRSGLINALVNLLLNANDAAPAGGEVRVRISDIFIQETLILSTGVKLPPNHYWVIDVIDSGAGVSAEIRAQIFDPFFSTKARKQGTGLGLSSVFSFATAHGGSVELCDHDGLTCFRMYLAEPVGTERGSAELTQPATPVRERLNILVVDDEAFVRMYAEKVFSQAGHRVVTADGLDEAVDAVRTMEKNFDVAVIDMVMPDYSGVEVLLAIREFRPSIKSILATGFATDEQLKRAEAAGFQASIRKPFTYKDIETALGQVLHVDQN